MAALDHVALVVPNLDAAVAFLCRPGMMTVVRWGTRGATGQRLVMLVDDHGQKLELIDGAGLPVQVLHVAFEADDVDGTFEDWLSAGAEAVRAPGELAAAQATTAMVHAPFGLEVQVIRYAPTSPDRTR